MKSTVYTVLESYAYDNVLKHFCTTKNSRTYGVQWFVEWQPPSLIRFWKRFYNSFVNELLSLLVPIHSLGNFLHKKFFWASIVSEWSGPSLIWLCYTSHYYMPNSHYMMTVSPLFNNVHNFLNIYFACLLKTRISLIYLLPFSKKLRF